MRILIISQYFYPENFRINDLCLGLKDKGHEVSVLTGKPNYPNGKFYDGYTFLNKRQDTYHGINVYRSNLIPRGSASGLRLLINYISFVFFAENHRVQASIPSQAQLPAVTSSPVGAGVHKHLTYNQNAVRLLLFSATN